MPSGLSTLDLATINAAQGVIVAAIRNQCCQWEQESADAVGDGRLSNAVMVQNWAFAADLLASAVCSEFSALFGKALDARRNFGKTTRSVGDQLLDALTLEVAAAQSEPVLPC
jgi:predicted ribonuclease toxin of YeeF-YezG toxin-antitoxin module